MALYGGNMVDVTTPDGRRLTVPSDFAAQFPDLQPLQPPEQQLAPSPIGPLSLPQQGEVGGAPSSMTPEAGAAPRPEGGPGGTPPPSPQPFAAMAPISAPTSAAAPMGPLDSGAGPVTSPSQAPPNGANAPKPARPMTDAQLAKLGNAGAYNAASSAIDEKAAATRAAAEIDANTATKIGEVSAERDAETERILSERQKIATDNIAKLDARVSEYDRKAKELANTKIDRKSDHPVLAAIGIMLGAIGAAMAQQQGKGDGRNFAFDAFLGSIDRKVAAQMQGLENKRGALALDREAINLERDTGHERLAEYDQRKMAALDQAARQIETIKAQTGSDRTKANADLALAGISEERAKVLGSAAEREQAKIVAEQKRKDDLAKEKATLGARYAELRQSDRHWQATFDEQKRQFGIRENNDLLQAEAKARAAGGKNSDAYAKAMKENEERGLKDPATGKMLLQPAGQKMMDSADKADGFAKQLRDKAQSEADPGRRQALLTRADAEEQNASAVRGEALLQYAVRGRNAEQSSKVQTTLGDTQTAISFIDEINNMRAKYGPQWSVTTSADQAMRTKMGLLELQIKEAFKLGALDKGSEAYLKRIAGGDPTKITTGDVSGMLDAAAGNKGSLDALAEALEARARNELSGAMEGADRFKFRRDKPTAETSAIDAAFASNTGRTPAELAAGEYRKVGAAGKAYQSIMDKTGERLAGSRPDSDRARAANESGSARFPQLTKPQADAVNLQLRAYKQNLNSDSPEAQAAAEKAAGTLLGLIANKERPALTTAMLGVLESEAPELYRRAVASLPETDPNLYAPGYGKGDAPPVPNQRDESDRRRTVMGMQSIGVLLETARAGDAAAKQEIARRAVAGDKEAQRAALDISSGRR